LKKQINIKKPNKNSGDFENVGPIWTAVVSLMKNGKVKQNYC